MRFRAVIVLIALGVVLAPCGAEAQSTATGARVGLLSGDAATGRHLIGALREGLRDLGYVEGRNLVIETRDARGALERLPALAAELAALRIDVLVTTAGMAPWPASRRRSQFRSLPWSSVIPLGLGSSRAWRARAAI